MSLAPYRYVMAPLSIILFILIVILTTLAGCGGSGSGIPSSISGQLTVILTGQSDPQGTQSDAKPYRLFRATGFPGKASSDGDPEFVTDQIIVRYKPGFNPLFSTETITKGGYRVVRSSDGMDTGVQVILKLEEAERAVLNIEAQKERTLQEIDYLNTLPYVEYAQPNYIYRPLFVPNDPEYDASDSGFTRKYIQWHFPLIKMDHVWEEWDPGDGLFSSLGNLSGVVVAVIDTGIARNNSGDLPTDLNGVILTGDEYDFISDPSVALDGDGRDSDATDLGDNGNFSTFHGTHVAGTIGAITNNGFGVASIGGGSPSISGVKIMPLRTLGFGGGTTEDVREAVLYAAQLSNASGQLPSVKADVINLSLGSPAAGSDFELENAINQAYNSGVVIVGSSGNAGTTEPWYPAAFEKVISVSAVDITGTKASYSSYGDTVFIAGPGGSSSYDLNFDSKIDGVLSTMAKLTGSTYAVNQFVFLTGTSMAAPHVSAVAALVKEALEDRSAYNSPADVENILKNTAINLGEETQTPTKDQFYGWGLVNAYEAIVAGLNSTIGPEVFPKGIESPFTKRIQLEKDDFTSSFTIESIEDGSAITITGINQISDYISDYVSLSQSTGTANPRLQIDIELLTAVNPILTNGSTWTTTLEILWENASGTVYGSEYFYVLYNYNGFITDPSKIGDVYVAAIDIHSTSDIVDLIDITNHLEGFRYTIKNIPTGSYMIGASTDLDDDGVIFGDSDQDEIFGFYPDSFLPEIIEFSQGDFLENINFSISDAF